MFNFWEYQDKIRTVERELDSYDINSNYLEEQDLLFLYPQIIKAKRTFWILFISIWVALLALSWALPLTQMIITSGSIFQFLWLVLLPFLSNKITNQVLHIIIMQWIMDLELAKKRKQSANKS